MPRIELNPIWVNRIRNETSTRVLLAELDSVQRTIEMDRLYPYRKESEVLELKKQKIALKCKIKILFNEEGVGVNVDK